MDADGTKPRGRTIEDSIAIDASAAEVWSILADVDGWPSWNPLYPAATGMLRAGETLAVAVALPGHKPQPARPVVTEATAGRRFRYLTKPMGGLIHGHRFVEIAVTGPASCMVRNGETLGGLLGPLLGRAIGGTMKTAFEQMNAALKKRAQSR